MSEDARSVEGGYAADPPSDPDRRKNLLIRPREGIVVPARTKEVSAANGGRQAVASRSERDQFCTTQDESLLRLKDLMPCHGTSVSGATRPPSGEVWICG